MGLRAAFLIGLYSVTADCRRVYRRSWRNTHGSNMQGYLDCG